MSLKRSAIILSITTLTFASLAFFILPAASAIPGPSGEKPAQSEIRDENVPRIAVSLYLENIRSFNLYNGDFSAEFLLIQECDRPCEINDQFEVKNGWADSVELIDRHERSQTFRIRASLVSDHNVRHYPFDSHRLPIVIKFGEDYEADYVAGTKSGYGREVFVPGFELDPAPITRVVEAHSKVLDENQKLFLYSIEGHRILTASLLRLLPPLLFVLVGIVCLMTRPNVEVLSEVLLGSVFYQIFLNQNIPPISGLMFSEIFMTINYITLSLGIFTTLLLHRNFADKTRDRLVFISVWAIPLLWLILQGINIAYLVYSITPEKP
ncbi:MAG TPA: hypothetical protein VHC46_01250 [Thermodesulfobacteriota bacterium]|nr:hypothetical protein [Thermodesulfobacteriota bacterium]